MPVIYKTGVCVHQLFGLLAFMLVITSIVFCKLSGVNPFHNFVVMLCVLTTAILYIILVFKLQFRIFRCQCIFWPRVVSWQFCREFLKSFKLGVFVPMWLQLLVRLMISSSWNICSVEK